MSQPDRAVLRSLTGLRAVAALAIFANHSATFTSGRLFGHVAGIVGFATIGVDFFFGLSGFVLAWTWSTLDTPWRFYRRRFARIYPAYLMSLLLALPVAAYVGEAAIGRHLLLDLGLVQSWVPHSLTYFSINPPAWTLSCEAFFYLTFPWWFSRVAALGLRHRRIAALDIYLYLLGAELIAGHIGGDTAVWVQYVAPPGQLLLFALGSLLALEVRAGTLPTLSFRGSVGAFVAAYVVAHDIPSRLVLSLLIPPTVAVLTAAAQADVSGRGTVFARRSWVFLGELSYCFYLVHLTLIRLAVTAVGTTDSTANALARITLALLASGVLALALHLVVERPLELRLRGVRTRRSAVQLA